MRHSKVFMKGNNFDKQTLNILGKYHEVLHCLLAAEHFAKILPTRKAEEQGLKTERRLRRATMVAHIVSPIVATLLRLSTGSSACTMSPILKCKWR